MRTRKPGKDPSKQIVNNGKNKGSMARSVIFIVSVLTICVVGLTVSDKFLGSAGTRSSAQERLIGPAKDGTLTDIKNITPEGRRQIAALIEEKESRTPVQRKIDSNLIFEIKKQRGQEIARGISTMETGLNVDSGGVRVDVSADVSPKLLDFIRAQGGAIIDSLPYYHAITAWLPLNALERLAERADVRFVMPNSEAQVQKRSNAAFNDLPQAIWNKDRTPNLLKLGSSVVSGTVSAAVSAQDMQTRPTFAQRAQRVREFLASKITSDPETGSINSEGDSTHQANTARSTIGPNGTGIKIGIISDGTTAFAAAQGTGNLPSTLKILPGQIGSCGTASTCNEGTAMLEIVHDIAPGAELYFATANPTIARFAQNVRDLRAAGCDIIIDDVFYFVETPFQDGQAPAVVSNTNGGVVVQAVKDVTAAGAMYFSSAGNQGNVDDATASCYQGDFVSAGTIALLPGGTVHDFGGGAQFDVITQASGATPNGMNLYWADPLGGAANDYDLFVLNSTSTAVLGSSTNIQSGTQDPFEQVGGVSGGAGSVNTRVVVFKKTGAADRFFHITINANGAGRLGTATPGTTKGHSMPANAYGVAATPAQAPGPFPGAFTIANSTEAFTSDGPRRIFFNEDSSAITPGNFSSTGGLLRQKPDITAADGTSVTGSGGFPTTFFGTSAAAPHAGAIAALLKSGLPTPTNAQIRTALLSTALDIETAGVDRNTGAGIIMPLPAMAALGQTAQAVINKGTVTVTEFAGFSDGDSQVEKFERGNLVISQLINVGAANASSVTATLTTTTPGVGIVPPTNAPYAYANMASAGGTASNATPYRFFLGSAYTCGTPVDFVLTVNFTDSSAKSQQIKFSVDLATTLSVSTTMDVTAPPANPAYTAATGTQTNRVTRGGNGSNCTTNNAYPGTTAATNPRFDAYTFTATVTGCNTVTLTGGNGSTTGLFVVVYSGAFNPVSVSTNYLADSGSSPGTGGIVTLGFNATAGLSYTVVVSEVTPNTTQNYTVTVAGPSLTTCNFAGPTAASVPVSGRVLTNGGIPIRNASVMLQDGGGNVFSAVTSSLGYYNFPDVPVGNYVIGVSSKRYTIAPRVISVLDTVEDLDLVAEP